MAAVHAVEALPVQAVHESSVILATLFMIAAHDVQTRFVVVVQAVDSYSVSEQAEAHSEHPVLVKVWKPAAHVAAEQSVEALPVQAVHDPSRIPATEFMIAAHDVQTRFDDEVQAVVSLVPVPQADRHSVHVLLLVLYCSLEHDVQTRLVVA